MELKSIVNSIIFLPKEFKKPGTGSTHRLLEESGYFEFYDQIHEADLLIALNENPDCIADWQQWSEDKRSGGWYLQRHYVGYYPEPENTESFDYPSLAEACAAFMKREVESIRKI